MPPQSDTPPWVRLLRIALIPLLVLRLLRWLVAPVARTFRRNPIALFVWAMVVAIAVKAFLAPVLEAARSALLWIDTSSHSGFLVLLLVTFLISARFAIWHAYAWGWGWRGSGQLKFEGLPPDRRSERRGQLLRYLYDRSHGIPKRMIPAREITKHFQWTMGELVATTLPLVEKGIQLVMVDEARWLIVLFWRGHRLALTAVGVLKVEEALQAISAGNHTVNITGAQGGVQVQVATINSSQQQATKSDHGGNNGHRGWTSSQHY
jgi:hypothetical protein